MGVLCQLWWAGGQASRLFFPQTLILAVGSPSRHPTVTAQNNNNAIRQNSAGRSRSLVGARLKQPEKPSSTVVQTTPCAGNEGTTHIKYPLSRVPTICGSSSEEEQAVPVPAYLTLLRAFARAWRSETLAQSPDHSPAAKTPKSQQKTAKLHCTASNASGVCHVMQCVPLSRGTSSLGVTATITSRRGPHGYASKAEAQPDLPRSRRLQQSPGM